MGRREWARVPVVVGDGPGRARRRPGGSGWWAGGSGLASRREWAVGRWECVMGRDEQTVGRDEQLLHPSDALSSRRFRTQTIRRPSRPVPDEDMASRASMMRQEKREPLVSRSGVEDGPVSNLSVGNVSDPYPKPALLKAAGNHLHERDKAQHDRQYEVDPEFRTRG